MTLPSSGPLSMSAINAEFARGNDLNSYRGTVWYTDAGGSGTFTSTNLGFDQFYGKRPTSPSFSGTISSNQTNLNLRTWALANGWNGSSAATITIASGVYVYSTSTGNAGLTIDGAWPGGVTLVNGGYIMGMGGAGADGTANSGAGNPGGPAISLGVNCTITNNSYIGGGGGGGSQLAGGLGGGGAGGGAGGGLSGSGAPPAAGGGPGATGGNGVSYVWPNGKAPIPNGSGGGGGRIMPGVGGVSGNSPSTAAGRGGKGGGSGGGGGADGQRTSASGGAGGSGGAVGGNAFLNYYSGGGGGGWGAAGGNNPNYQSGGSGGKAIALNGYTATRNGSGTTYGTVS